MPPTELRQQRTVRGRSLNRPHLHAQRCHPGANRMLRHNGQPNHDQNAEPRRRNEARKRPRPGQPRHQDRNPANDPNHVHPPKPIPHHRPGLIPASQDPKRPWRHHKAEKHIAPQPQTKSKKFNGAQNGRHKIARDRLETRLQQSTTVRDSPTGGRCHLLATASRRNQVNCAFVSWEAPAETPRAPPQQPEQQIR
jgi:hypothetical protein